MTFREELIQMLKNHDVPFDEKYLFMMDESSNRLQSGLRKINNNTPYLTFPPFS